MFDLQEWMSQSVAVRATFEPAKTVTRADRLAFLVIANGGFDVRGWGYLGANNKGHQIGLEQDEALELIGYGGFIAGIESAGVNTEMLTAHLQAYYANHG